MASDVRITMLGYTKAGKTCYLLGMYHRLASTGVNGLTLRTVESDDGRRLDALWEKLENGGEHRWPPPNPGIFEEYKFNLMYTAAPIMTVDWVDYRGGTIDELFSAADVKELMSYLTQSTCVFLTVSGEYLVEKITLSKAKENFRVHRMNEFMEQLVRKVQPSHERPLPVAILITKYDYLQAATGHNPDLQDRLERVIKELFSPLFAKRIHIVMRAPSFLTAICPVTLGLGLAADMEKGKASPIGAEHPIFFAVWASLRQQITDAEKGNMEAEQLADLKSTFDLLTGSLSNVPIYLEGSRLPS